MAMFVWPEGEVSGSVNVAELEEIQKGLKGLGKRKLAALQWPIESAANLSDQLSGVADDDDDSEPEPPKAAKASAPQSSADAKAEAEKAAAMSKVDLPAMLSKSTPKKGAT